MKRISCALLITTVAIGSVVNATQQAPQRPTTSVPTPLPLKTDNSICPDELKMPQLNELKGGTLKLGGHVFTLHTPKTEFEKMLPGKLQIASKKLSVAKIAEGQAIPGRVIISSVRGHMLKCTYNFRTALGSKTLQDHTTFAILSEPTDVEKEPKGLNEAMAE